MRKNLILIILLIFSIGAYAQSNEQVSSPQPDEVTIGEMMVWREGTEFNIKYTLLLGEDVRWCKTRLFVSIDGGKSFRFNPTMENITGDHGQLSSGGVKVIKYDITQDKTQLAGMPVVFKVEVVAKDVPINEVLVAAQASVFPQISYGIMFGMVRKYGWYVKARSDFNSPASSYDCTSDGKVPESGGYMWTEGTSQKSRLSITAGGMFRASRGCYPYVGLGYGSRGSYWKDIQGEWAKVTDLSCAGLALDAGLVFKMGKFAVSFGVSNTAFKYTEAEVGIGIMF